MAQTMVEKILSTAAGYRVHAGEALVIGVDRVLLQDGTAPRVLDRLDALGVEELALAGRTHLFIDHTAPPPTIEFADAQRALRARARELKFDISEAGCGISHQRMVEDYAKPGEILVGADSHTCTAGALGSFSLGMGSTDVACTIALGEAWILVPAAIKVELVGELSPGVTIKDAMLSMVGRLGGTGANYQALEFVGPSLDDLSQEDRFVMANLAAEVGAKTALIPADDVTHAYLKAQGRAGDFEAVVPDPDADYERHLKLDLGKQTPVVARPGRHDDIVPVKEVVGEKIDQIVIGSCTNGRVSDFGIAAEVLKGKHIRNGCRLVLAPASREVLERSMADGIMPALLEAGGALVTPGCGPCVGIHQGVLADGDRCLATQSRNFPGRMGSAGAKIWLGSPATAAATALKGEITDPRGFFHGA